VLLDQRGWSLGFVQRIALKSWMRSEWCCMAWVQAHEDPGNEHRRTLTSIGLN
jgi:hypothetical protein